MTLPPLHLPLIAAGLFGDFIGRVREFVAHRVRRSDQGMWPSLSIDLRAQTVALHRRLTVLTREFHRLADLARQGRLRVYPDRASPRRGDMPRPGLDAQRGAENPGRRSRDNVVGWPGELALTPSPIVVQGPTLPAVATRGFGWMLGFVPAHYTSALAVLLESPELASLIAASPAVARLVRPLCRGLGVVPPEGVFPAARRRPARAKACSSAPESSSAQEPGRSSGVVEPAPALDCATDTGCAGDPGRIADGADDAVRPAENQVPGLSDCDGPRSPPAWGLSAPRDAHASTRTPGATTPARGGRAKC